MIIHYLHVCNEGKQMEGYYEFTKEQFDRVVDELATVMDNYAAQSKAEKIFDILGIDYDELED